jgi:hypothetical protein
MKHVTIHILLLLGIFLGTYSAGCQAQRINPVTYTGKQLVFGNGGGFTGRESTYVLLDNGYLFSIDTDKHSGKENYTPLKKLPGKITQQLFSKADALQLEQVRFSHPGNVYYFVGLKKKQDIHRITWGDPGHEAPADAENLYHQLTASLPQ